MSKTSSTPPTEAPSDLAEAIRAAGAAPDRAELWDEAERLADVHQRPEDVAELYRSVLAQPLDEALALELCERAAGFLGDWFEDSTGVVEVLSRALAIAPGTEWAFRKLTMLHTVERRWDELLALYDRVLAVTPDGPRRVELFTEAAQIAKDLAGRADRAIGYLTELSRISPADGQLTSSLERLLDREGRHRELVALWRERLAELAGPAALALRAQIAACLLDRLESPAEALDAAAELFADPDGVAQAVALFERAFAAKGASAEVRARALGELRRRYAAAGRTGEIIRLLGMELARAEGADRAALHRELAELLTSEGREAEALDHSAELTALDPEDVDAAARLRVLAERVGRLDRYADALVRAADACAESDAGRARAIALLLEAATVRCDAIADPEGATALFSRIFRAEGVPSAAMLEVSRRLDDLHARADRKAERLEALWRRASLEEDAARRGLFATAARLAEELGDSDRALAAWGLVLADAPADREAHAARIALYDREGRWEALIDALDRAAAAEDDPADERAHLVRAARVRAERLADAGAAIDAWRAIEGKFGANEETTDALAALLDGAGRWSDLAVVLERGLRDSDDAGRRIAMQERLGDVYRTRAGEPERALACYGAVLASVPDHAGARAGLGALLAEPACRSAAVGMLLEAFEATGDWAGRLSLLEHRLEMADGGAARSALLCEAADLHEQRAGDAIAALGALGRALPLSPDDRTIEERALALASQTGQWEVVARALGEAVLASSSEARAAELHYQRGAVLELRLADASGALAAYLAALEIAPDRLDVARATTRSAAAEGRWDVAARALVSVARARGAWDRDLVAFVEDAAAAASAWDGVTAELGAAVVREAELPADLAGEIERTIAVWHRDRRRDPAAAEEALLRALERSAGGVDTLQMLAGVQRRAPGRPLVDTLIRLADAGEGVLAALHEAATVAVDALHDEALSRAIVERLLAEVASRLASGEGEDDLAELAAFAIRELVHLASAEGDHLRAVEILVDAARLPLGPEVARARLHEAAAIAEERLRDPDRAVALYRAILEATPDDDRALGRLSAIFAGGDRVGDLLALRRHQLALAQDREERIDLRLSIAELYGRAGDTEARLGVLRENLAEEPGHPRSLEELAALLGAGARHGELASALEVQAALLEEHGEGARAAELWTRASEIAESGLGDVGRALAARRRVVAAMPTAETFDALARLSFAGGDPAAAVGWLERRIEALSPDDAPARIETLARLAAAHVGAGEPEIARSRLEAGLREHPAAEALREPLHALYRAAGAWELLVDLLTSPDHGPAKLEHLREAADICVKRLGSRERAIPILEATVALAPQDRATRLALASALRGAGELDRARAALAALLDEFGRRRSPERAEVHFQLAQVAMAAGDVGQATTQLETATAMSPEHPGALRMLAGLYRDAGDLARAERMYGALLLIALRQRPASDEDPDRPARSEVMINLHWILKRLEQSGRADEMLASAFEAAKRGDFEAERLEHALREAGDHALLLRALEARLARTEHATARAEVLSDMADALAGPLDRPEEALRALLTAIELAPSSTRLYERAAAAARRAGAIDRWAEVLAGLAERADPAGAAPLFFSLGELHERDLGDPARALAAYARAEALGADPVPVWRAIDRVSAAAGDRAAQIRVLRNLVSAGDAAGEGASLTDDLYRLAELELSTPGNEAEGTGSLEWAIGREPRYAIAGAMLRGAAEAGGSFAVLAMYERVARASADPAMLLDALSRASTSLGASMDIVREAFALADAAGDVDRAEALLARAVEIGEANTNGLGEAVWAFAALADRREAAGALDAAVALLGRAIEAADHDDAVRLTARSAAIAEGKLASLPLAADAYERLLARDRHDREVWLPLLDLYRKIGDPALLDAKLREAIECAFDAVFRIDLRMERARLLEHDRPEDAVIELEEVLQEDLENDVAAGLLTTLYERLGNAPALADLMERRLSLSRLHDDAGSVLALSLQLGEIWAKDRPDRAIDLYRTALDTAPDDAVLLGRLLALYAAPEQAADRADILERLAGLAQGREAAERALALAAIRVELEDDEGVVRALELGFRADPSHAAIRDRLAAFYTQHERWAELADMLAFEGAALSGAASVARLREAASIWLERLDRPADAARALGLACERSPADLALLVDHARALSLAGGRDEAIARVGAALDRAPASPRDRAALLRLRAELRVAPEDLDGAVADLELAYRLDPRAAARDLTAALERLLQTPAGAADRALTLRLADVLLEIGDDDRARAVLASSIARAPSDTLVLSRAAALAGYSGRWDSAVELCERLVELERGPARVDAALLLSGACAHAGYPLDARPLLEMVFVEGPPDARIRDQLRAIYEQLHANRELAGLYLAEANLSADAGDRFAALRRAGQLLLDTDGDAAAAVAPLEAARELRPKDTEIALLLTDAYIRSNRLQEAANFLDQSIAAQKGRRSREVSMMQHRMAQIARAVGDRENELAWLNAAFDSDAQNGDAASHLADVATEFGQLDLAVKALKAITLMKSPKPITRAMAYLRQAMIAQHQGDVRKAVTLAKKAQSEDPSLEEAAALLAQLGSA